MSKNIKIRRRVATVPLAFGVVAVFATVLGVGLSTVNNTYADSEYANGAINEPLDQDKLNKLCEVRYNYTQGAVLADDGNILCGDTKMGEWNEDQNGNILTSWPTVSSGNIDKPDTSSGISIIGAIQLCKEQYGVDGVSYGEGTILCGNTTIGVWSLPPEGSGATSNPELEKTQQLLDRCQKYTEANNKVITFLSNGDVKCGSSTLAKWSDSGNGGVNIEFLPDTSSGISISGLIELCKKDYNIDGATFTADGKMNCGDNNIGAWGAIEDRIDSQDVLDVCTERYGISDKILYLANGDITCGGHRVATWDKITEAITILSATSNSGSSNRPSQSQTIREELQSLINEIKNDPLYKLYAKLIEIVKKAEELLESIDVSSAAEYAAPEQQPDQPYVARYASANQNTQVILANASTSELVSAVKAIGDALRSLGIDTHLGINLTTASTNDLRYAVNTAKNTAKYAEYFNLVNTLERAETALANGTFDNATLAELTTAKAAVSQNNAGQNSSTQAPETGVNSSKGFVSATATVAITAVASVAFAGIGFIVIRKRLAIAKK